MGASLDGRVHAAARGTPQAKALRRLRQAYAKQKEIRDRIATRRQAVENRRGADLRATLALWHGLTYERECDDAVRQSARCV